MNVMLSDVVGALLAVRRFAPASRVSVRSETLNPETAPLKVIVTEFTPTVRGSGETGWIVAVGAAESTVTFRLAEPADSFFDGSICRAVMACDPSVRSKSPTVVIVVLVPDAVALPMATPSAYNVTVAPLTVLGTVN